MSFAPLNVWSRGKIVGLVRGGFLAGLALLAGGCTSVYQRVTVRSWTLDQYVAGSFALRDVSKPEAERSPRFAEAAELLKHALLERGLREAAPGTVPSLFIDVDYGIRPRQRSESLSFPGLSLERGRETTGNAQTGTNADGTPQYQSYTDRTPDRFVMREGSGSVRSTTTTVYGKFLRITASENTPSASGFQTMQLWRVEVNSDPQADDRSRDVGKQLPVLVAASIYFLGKTSDGTRYVDVNKNEAAALVAAKGEVRSGSGRAAENY